MKIGLLTYYRSNVFGGFWQSLSHLRALSELFDTSEVSLIPVLHATNIQKIKSIKKRPQHILHSLKRYICYQLERKEYFSKYILRGTIGVYENSRLRDFTRDNKINLLITGADTCLDLTTEDIQMERLPIFWPDPYSESKHAFFSASCGDLSHKLLAKEIFQQLSAAISQSVYLGFRDKSTETLFAKINTMDTRSEFTPDPAFWGFQKELNSQTSILKSSNDKSNICLISSIGSTFTSIIIEFFDQRYTLVNLNSLSLKGYPTIFPGPISQLKVINDASFLITSSFHETIAAASSGIPFIAVERLTTQSREFGMTKISDLCHRLGCPSQYIDPANYPFINSTEGNKLFSQYFELAIANVEPNMNAARQMSSLFESSLNNLVSGI